MHYCSQFTDVFQVPHRDALKFSHQHGQHTWKNFPEERNPRPGTHCPFYKWPCPHTKSGHSSCYNVLTTLPSYQSLLEGCLTVITVVTPLSVVSTVNSGPKADDPPSDVSQKIKGSPMLYHNAYVIHLISSLTWEFYHLASS